MAPNIRSAQLETRSARAKLAPRRKVYAVRVAPRIRVGYRRNVSGPGTWSVVCANGSGGSWMERIALADDMEDADGTAVMNFWQAVERAKKVARTEDGIVNSERPITVREAVESYQRDLATRGRAEQNAILILKKLPSALASMAVAALTRRDVIAFRNGLLQSGVKKSSAHRYMVGLIAALNYVCTLDERLNDRAWKRLPVLPNSREARTDVILSSYQVLEIVRIAYDQEPEFGIVVETLSVAGARFSQVLRLTVGDILPNDRLAMPVSAKGRGTKKVQKVPVPITASLAIKLRSHAAGRKPSEPLLVNAKGKPWPKNAQTHRFPGIVKAAGLDPAQFTSYSLRHSSIVRQLIAGTPIRLTAAVHDTSVGQIEAHYSRYIANHGDDMIRKALLNALPAAANDNRRHGRLVTG
jgi:integrase